MNTDERRAKKEILERWVRDKDLSKFELHWKNFLVKGHKAQNPKDIIKEFAEYLDSIYCKDVIPHYEKKDW